MRLRISIIILTIFISSIELSAQQLPNTTQYLVNRYLLSPSYAGQTDNTQVFLGYRYDWGGFEGAPKTTNVSGYVQASEKVWIGAEIIADKADLYNNTYAKLSYTYQANIGYESNLYFGLWGSFFQNRISLTDAVIYDMNDPLLKDKTELTGFSLNAGASAVFKWREGHLGVSVPYLFQNKDIYAVSDVKNIVELNQQVIGHISYKFRINYSLDIEPLIVYRWTKDFASQTEVSAILYYRENYWGAATYRDIGKAAISVGGRFSNNFTLNYTFEFVTKKYIAQPSSTHEFTLGIAFQKNKNKVSKWRRNTRYNSRY